MKKDIQYEEQFIFAIDRIRRNVKEILLIAPLSGTLLFALIGAPIIVAWCEVPIWSYPLLVTGPVVLATLFLIIRKKIIMTRFIRIGDVSDAVEMIEILSSDLENFEDGDIFMFKYSEYMVKIVYNWLYSLGVTWDGKLKMYKVFYDNHAPIYLAIRASDLVISDDVLDRYKEEARICLRLSDMAKGKAVNVKIYERVTNSKAEETYK